uniref:Secreted protein n=1 Tax=Knipowitschia caucasica TaxID=637954 RepID=A0AAV2LM73_KNICA
MMRNVSRCVVLFTLWFSCSSARGPTPLMELKSMNMITSFIPEYQHSVCLGVTRQITSLWFDSRHHNQDWYIGSKDLHTRLCVVEQQGPVEVGVPPPTQGAEDPESVRAAPVPRTTDGSGEEFVRDETLVDRVTVDAAPSWSTVARRGGPRLQAALANRRQASLVLIENEESRDNLGGV